MTIEEARKKMLDPMYFGCMIIKSGDADGQLAGARNTTGNTLRPALQIIKTAPGITCISGAMISEHEGSPIRGPWHAGRCRCSCYAHARRPSVS
jgi:phosphotransacetylase